jgi:hypothetical protein
MARQGVSVVLFDQPSTMGIARKILKESKAKNITSVGGDFFSDDIGSGYDLVFISQIIHSFSLQENLGLLKKSYKALNPGGKIAIQEFSIGNDRAHPAPAALFSINMLINTKAGRCYTVQEMKTLLTGAGFKGIKTADLGDTVVITARKKP